jgi:hypothetical protein
VSRGGVRVRPSATVAGLCAFAIGTAMLLAVSIEGFFSLQTFFMAVTALCFALSAVSQEG